MYRRLYVFVFIWGRSFRHKYPQISLRQHFVSRIPRDLGLEKVEAYDKLSAYNLVNTKPPPKKKKMVEQDA